MNIKQIFYLSFILFLPLKLHAVNNFSDNTQAPKVDFPIGCYEKGFQFIDMDLRLADKAGAGQYIYLLRNKVNTKIGVIHIDESTASAGWSSEIGPGKWSAIVIDKAGFTLQCVEIRPGAEQVVSCEYAVAVCTYPQADFTKTQKGSYWIAENLAKENLLDTITRRDIILAKTAK